MPWPLLALASPALWAASNLIDADLLGSRRKHATSLLILAGIVASVRGVYMLTATCTLEGGTAGNAGRSSSRSVGVMSTMARCSIASTPLGSKPGFWHTNNSVRKMLEVRHAKLRMF